MVLIKQRSATVSELVSMVRKVWLLKRFFLFVLLLGFAGRVNAAEQGRVRIQRAEDSRSFIVSAPGLVDFKGTWSATIQREGRSWTLTSQEGVLSTGAVISILFSEQGAELLFRLKSAPRGAGVMAQAGVRNVGMVPLCLSAVTPIAATLELCGPREDWLLTGLHPKTRMADVLKNPRDVYEYGSFYRSDGVGFLFGPVGEPIAYVNAKLAPGGGNEVTFAFSADMSGVRVDPGETRWGQEVAVVMEPPCEALVHWAEWVGLSHGARTSKGSLIGWSNRYNSTSNAMGKVINQIIDAVKNSGGRLRPEVIEFEKVQDVQVPEGFAYYAQRMASVGARPGRALELFRDKVNWEQMIQPLVTGGVSFLKVNLHGTAQVSDKETSFETERRLWRRARDLAGDAVYLSVNHSFPDRATVGYVDSGRIGYRPLRERVRGGVEIVLRSFPLNRRWYSTDMDAYYMATELRDVDPVVGGWPMARTWISMVGLSASSSFTSDPWNQEKFSPYWRNVEILTPPAREQIEVLDLCTGKEWPRLIGRVHREWGDATVALLWNPGNTEQSVALDFAKAGMDPRHRYAVWSFWEDRYLGVARGQWVTPPLPASGSQHLVFTDLDRAANRPVVIGSNLHIWCGAAEIRSMRAGRTSMVIELSDAGARAGDLYVYSRFQPVFKAVRGCVVNEVSGAGENVWRISLRERQPGEQQRIELTIVLPMVRQIWFWVLIAGLVASLVFAVWRYMAVLRLQRVYALEQERTRIARDLHDDLGANLTQVALLSRMAGEMQAEPDELQEQTRQITKTADEMVKSLETIVWAVRPENDSLRSLVEYMNRRTDELFEQFPRQYEFVVHGELPAVSLHAEWRHNIYMAYREALTNALKHSGATRFAIELSVLRGMCTIIISDNGKGFRIDKARSGGMGLKNMRLRMEQLHGRCELSSAEGRGTTVKLEFPLPKA